MGHSDPTIETLGEAQGGRTEEDHLIVTPLTPAQIRAHPRWPA